MLTKFGEIVREDRLKAGLSQRKMADVIGIKPGALCNIEKGRPYWISPRVVLGLHDLLGWTPEKLGRMDALAEAERKRLRKRDQA
jgi:transcriptional regulator with XRE-family HTH domain